MHTTNASFNPTVIDDKNEKVEGAANNEIHEEEESRMASRPGVDTKNADHFVHEDSEILENNKSKRGRKELPIANTQRLPAENTKVSKMQQTDKAEERKASTSANITDDSVKTALSISTLPEEEARKYSFIRNAKENVSTYQHNFDDVNVGSDCDPYDKQRKEINKMDMKKLKAYFSETMSNTSLNNERRSQSPKLVTAQSSSGASTPTGCKRFPSKLTLRVRKTLTKEGKFSTQKKSNSNTSEKPSNNNIQAAKNIGIGILSMLKVKKEKKSPVKK